MRRPPRLRFWLVAVPLLGLAVWLLVLDSYSIMRRVGWSRELTRLEAENAALEAELLSLEEQAAHADEPEVVERIAREQYGMRRPGETVYRVEAPPAE